MTTDLERLLPCPFCGLMPEQDTGGYGLVSCPSDHTSWIPRTHWNRREQPEGWPKDPLCQHDKQVWNIAGTRGHCKDCGERFFSPPSPASPQMEGEACVFGYSIDEMDTEAFINIRNWLEQCCTHFGARVDGGGIGMGRADFDIELEGHRYNVAIRPLEPYNKSNVTSLNNAGSGARGATDDEVLAGTERGRATPTVGSTAGANPATGSQTAAQEPVDATTGPDAIQVGTPASAASDPLRAGEPISREEALRTSREILEQAERERTEDSEVAPPADTLPSFRCMTVDGMKDVVLKSDVARLQGELAEARRSEQHAKAVLKSAERDLRTRLVEREKELEGMREWLDNNTTFYDVDAGWPRKGTNIPTLALVSKRIWYHATDDTTSYPFSAVLSAASQGAEHEGK